MLRPSKDSSDGRLASSSMVGKISMLVISLSILAHDGALVAHAPVGSEQIGAIRAEYDHRIAAQSQGFYLIENAPYLAVDHRGESIVLGRPLGALLPTPGFPVYSNKGIPVASVDVGLVFASVLGGGGDTKGVTNHEGGKKGGRSLLEFRESAALLLQFLLAVVSVSAGLERIQSGQSAILRLLFPVHPLQVSLDELVRLFNRLLDGDFIDNDPL